MGINKILRKYRVTAKQVSEQTGIKYGTMLKYSSGERKPSVSNAKKIAEVLHMDWWELFEESVDTEEDTRKRRY